MNVSANITMIEAATAETISNVFVNNNCAAVTLQITGSYTSATVLVEGLVNLSSNAWVSLGAIELGDFELNTDGLSEKSLYQIGIEGIPRVRIHVTAVSGGDITVVCQFGNAVIDPSADMTPANLTPITAYDMAVAGGYTGTKAQFETDMGNSATNATNAAASASAAAASATTASNAAANFAPAYSSSATYAVGDHVLYNGGYYVCNTAITTAEAWTAAHWTAVKVGPEITDLKTQLDDVTDFLIRYPENLAVSFLENEYIVRTNEDATITVSGDTISYTGSTLDADKWVAFPMDSALTDGTTYELTVSFSDNVNLSAVRISNLVTESSSGFTAKTFTQNGNVYTLSDYDYSLTANLKYLLIYMNRDVTSFTATVSCYVDGDDISLKAQIIGQNNLKSALSEKINTIIPAVNTNTNVFVGSEAGENTTESTSDDNGRYNTAIGVRAMEANTTGDHCTALGFQAMQKNTTGDGNTALGEDTLYENTTGTSNTAVGAHCLQNDTGSGNVAVGTSALMNNTTGFFNTAVGNQAGRNFGTSENAITTDKYMTLIGMTTCKSVATELENSTAIGYNAKVSKSNQVVLGNVNVTELVFGAKKIVFNSDGTVTWEAIS